MALLYPLSLKLAGRRVLIVGGGTLARRKLAGLEPTGALVRLVAPDLAPGLGEGWPPERLQVCCRPFRADDLIGCTLAIGATDDPAVNRRVVETARGLGILANAVDDPGHCDFYMPAVLRRHGLELAVSTGGAFPGLTRAMREVLEAWLPESHHDALEGLYALRRALLESPLGPEERGRVLRRLARALSEQYLAPAAIPAALRAGNGSGGKTPDPNPENRAPERP